MRGTIYMGHAMFPYLVEAPKEVSVSKQPESTQCGCWPFASLQGLWQRKKKNSVQPVRSPKQLFIEGGPESLGYKLNRENLEITGPSPSSTTREETVPVSPDRCSLSSDNDAFYKRLCADKLFGLPTIYEDRSLEENGSSLTTWVEELTSSPSDYSASSQFPVQPLNPAGAQKVVRNCLSALVSNFNVRRALNMLNIKPCVEKVKEYFKSPQKSMLPTEPILARQKLTVAPLAKQTGLRVYQLIWSRGLTGWRL